MRESHSLSCLRAISLSLCHFCIACFIPCCRVPFVGRSRCGFDFMSFSMKFPWKSSNWITYEKQYRSAWRIGSLLNIHTHTEKTFLIAVYIQVKSQQFLSVALCLLCDFSVEITQLCATAARQSKWNESEKKSLELWPLKCNLFNQVCVCVYASASAALLAITANVHFVHFAYTNTHRRHNHTTVFTYSSLHVIRCAVGGKVVCRLLTIFQTKSTGKRFTILHPSEDCQQYFLRPVD